jgi:hypothetical protein
VRPGDLLRAHVLLAGHAVVGAALHRGVVGDDHAGPALHQADAGDDAGARRHAVVLALAGEHADFEEGRARIEQHLDAVAGQDLVARQVLLARLGRPAGQRLCGAARAGRAISAS